MSWFTILIGEQTEDTIAKLKKRHPVGCGEYHGSGFCILYSAGSPTFTFATDEHHSTLLAGLLIRRSGDDYHILRSEEITDALGSEILQGKFEGQYAAVYIANNKLTVINDRLGLRDVYYSRSSDAVIISTNPQYAAALLPAREIDMAAFGSRWLCFSQIDIRSVINGVSRLLPGERLSVEIPTGKLHSEHTPWLPEPITNATEVFTKRLHSLTTLPLRENIPTSLALSGGLDSRLLLSIYQTDKEFSSKIRTFTFGEPDHPDSVIAQTITNDLSLPHRQLTFSDTRADSYISELQDFVFHSFGGRKASTILHFALFKQFTGKNSIIIDGVYAELYRRQFLNNLLLRGKQYILTHRYDKIFDFIRLQRADIFRDDVMNMFRRSAISELENVLSSFPSPKEFGIENWIELFSIRSHMPNSVGYEQTRIDNYTKSMMPFTYPSLLETMFSMQISERKKGRLFRRLIHNNFPALEKYPLVRADVTYPYSFSTIPAYMTMQIKRKLGLNYKDTSVTDFLDTLKEYSLDMLASRETREYPMYDLKKIDAIVQGYYSGNTQLASQLDWWLSFETWRRVLKGT